MLSCHSREDKISCILYIFQIYANEIVPIFPFWKRFLTCQNSLICCKRIQKIENILFIEFGKDIIHKKEYWHFYAFFQELYFKFFEREEKHFHFSSRKELFGWKNFVLCMYSISEIISMRTNMGMSGEDISFTVF